jgi:hypothetical protein
MWLSAILSISAYSTSFQIFYSNRDTQAKGKDGSGSSGGGNKGKYRIIEYALAGGGKRSKVLSFKAPPLFLEATKDGQFVVAACASRLCVWSARERELWTCVAFDDKTPREGSLLQVRTHAYTEKREGDKSNQSLTTR